MTFECVKVKAIMSSFPKPWFIAGGWAIDIFLGKVTREHHDIEIGIFRKDQLDLKRYLQGWEFQKVKKGKFSTWEGEFLEWPIHEIHGKSEEYNLEILLNERSEKDFLYRRNVHITYPLENTWGKTNGIPYLNPAIVLLYKSKYTLEKDHHDFLVVKDFLNREQRKWLK